MEQRDIEVLLTLADELHFGRAAERLHVSTSRVSQVIRRLERRIGAPLFERTSRRVEPTAIGSRLVDDLRPARRAIQDAVSRATAAARGVRATLRIGFIGAASGRFVLEVAEAHRVEHPDCELVLREHQFNEGLDPLRRGEVDMALATLPAGGLPDEGVASGAVLVEEEQLLAVSAGHPFGRLASVSFADLSRTTVLRGPPTVPAFWDRALVPEHTPDGRPVERGAVFATTQEMLALVGVGAGTYPVSDQFTSYYVRPDVVYVPIRDVPPYERRFRWLATTEDAAIRHFDASAAAVARALRRQGR